jgi:glycyl-tRNA synthetase beta chain
LIRDPASSSDAAKGSGTPGQARGDDDVIALANLAERAARLAKLDLVSATVGEFPELQGLIGGRLAAAAGENPAVARAVAEHYRPVGPSDAVPTEPVAVAVALADKLDSLIGLYAFETPTGSKDAFAVRRVALGFLRILTENRMRARLSDMLARAAMPFQSAEVSIARAINQMAEVVPHFVVDRLKVQQREAGVRHDLIDAAFATGDDDLVRLLARTPALQSFLQTDDGANLLAGYKRAANIIAQEEKKDGRAYAIDLDRPLDTYIGETEKALARLFHKAEHSDAELLFDEVDDLLAREDFEGAMAALARLRAPVDDFFEQLMVNDPDPEARQRRLELLAGVRAAMRKVADFSKVEG